MKAVWYERKGAAKDVLQLGDLPTPEPGPGELLIRVRASGVNPSDTKGRSGFGGQDAMPFPRIIPHQDGAGEVVAAGSPELASRVGERVWFYEAQFGRPHGAAAEFVALPAHQALPLPDGVSFEAGASLGVPAMTAHRCVFADGPVNGKVILVNGGAGSVGRYAIQFARQGGARVIATVSREAQAVSVRAAGADLVLNRHTDDLRAAISAFAGREHGVDRVIEVAFGANLGLDLEVLARNGVLASYSSNVEETTIPYRQLAYLDATIRFVLVYLMDQAAHEAAAQAIGEALRAGWLQAEIGAIYPLSQVVAAHEAVESGAVIGKVVVIP